MPAATARIAAAAASSRARTRRPPWLPFDSFAFPAGSEMVRASAIADRNSSDGTGTTRPSAHPRLNPRTSSAPSLNPIPRVSNAARATPALSRASRSSASRHLSATIRHGCPNRSSATCSKARMSADRWPRISNSPRRAHSEYRRPTPSRSPRSASDGSAGNAARHSKRPLSGQNPAIADCAALVPRSIPQTTGPARSAWPSISCHKIDPSNVCTSASSVPRLRRSDPRAASKEGSRRDCAASVLIAASRSGIWPRLGLALAQVRLLNGGSSGPAACSWA